MIYKLRADRAKYLNFDIDAYAIEVNLGDYFLLDQPQWSGFWKPLDATFFDDSDDHRASLVPDITVWGTLNCLALNKKAYNALRDVLVNCGEFLPVVCESVPYWVFHSTMRLGLEYVDMRLSDRSIEENGFIETKSLVFHEQSLANEHVFQTEFNNYRNMYCTENFKSLVNSLGLTGLRFSDDLASVSEP